MKLYLKVKNFLSLKDISIEFKDFNVFVGPNAGGKSNIIKALGFISNFVREGVKFIDRMLQNRDLIHLTFLGKGGKIEFELRFGDFTYLLKMEASSLVEKLYFGNKILFSRESTPQSERLYFLDASNIRKDISTITTNTKVGRLSVPLKEIAQYEINPMLKESIYKLSSINTFSFAPDEIRSESPVTAPPTLDRSGRNLPRVILHYYLEKRSIFTHIENTLKMLIPEVEEIVPKIRGQKVEVAFKEKYSDMIIDPDFLSDGSLRILAILFSLFDENFVVAYEEPENCIHPHLLESVIDIMKKSGKTVILTTHSPYLLDYVDPENVILVAKVDGETKIKRLEDTDEIEAVRKYISEGGTLGEAWFSGIIGEV